MSSQSAEIIKSGLLKSLGSEEAVLRAVLASDLSANAQPRNPSAVVGAANTQLINVWRRARESVNGTDTSSLPSARAVLVRVLDFSLAR